MSGGRSFSGDGLEHPRAGEAYFKVQLGPMVSLPHPILSERWKRLTFVCTRGHRLLSAREVADLTIRSAVERDRLWRMLRERPAIGAEDLPGSV